MNAGELITVLASVPASARIVSVDEEIVGADGTEPYEYPAGYARIAWTRARRYTVIPTGEKKIDADSLEWCSEGDEDAQISVVL